MTIKIGVSGDVGSFSEEAGLSYIKKAQLKDTELLYLIDMAGVMSALDSGNIDIGVFPVVNNNSGLVWPAFEAMGKYAFQIIDEIHLDVEQCIFAKKMIPLTEISAIYSYPPAFNQCKLFLKNEVSGIPQINWDDMAKAARDLSNGKLPEKSAVIGSRRSCNVYGLSILATNIQDVKPNVTMFVVLKKIGK